MEKTESLDGEGSVISTARPVDNEHGILKPYEKGVLLFLIGFRILNAVCVKTFFQPDEYYQSLEPAWEIAFGKESGAWITWEWQNQLRSSLHPVLFAALYSSFDKLMRYLSLSPPLKATVLLLLPKLLQAGFAAIGDYYTWKLTGRIYGRRSSSAWTVLLLTIFNPWQWFCSTRTFSNSFEVMLTIVALYCWPWQLTASHDSMGKPTKQELYSIQQNRSADLMRICFVFAGIACVLRPTNLLLWTSLITTSIVRLSRNRYLSAYFNDLCLFLREAVLCGGTVLAVSSLSDRLYFGMWTFPPYQWLNFNITQSLAVFYGTNDWHYYISQGLPLLLTTYLPFALFSLWDSTSIFPNMAAPFIKHIRFDLTFMVLTMIATLSLISHKEVRFIYPLLPILHVLTAPYFMSFFVNHLPFSSFKDSAAKNPVSITSWRLLLFIVLFTTNVVIGVYTTQFHQRGVIDVLGYLRHQYEQQYFPIEVPALNNFIQGKSLIKHNHASNETFAAFLMPCHSTPWRSHLIYSDLHAWALTCEPPLHIPANIPDRATYRDEADRFYDNSQIFLKTEIGTNERPWPRYIVGFQGIEPTLKRYLETEKPEWRLKEKWNGFNSHWHDDRRRIGNVIVWELINVSRR